MTATCDQWISLKTMVKKLLQWFPSNKTIENFLLQCILLLYLECYYQICMFVVWCETIIRNVYGVTWHKQNTQNIAPQLHYWSKITQGKRLLMLPANQYNTVYTQVLWYCLMWKCDAAHHRSHCARYTNENLWAWTHNTGTQNDSIQTGAQVVLSFFQTSPPA